MLTRPDLVDVLRRATEALPVLVSVVDASGVVEYMNETGLAWLGRTAADVVGQPLRDALGAEAWLVVGPRMQAALQGARQEFDSSVAYPGGRRDVHASYLPQQGPDGSIRAVVALVADMSAQKAVERELRRELGAVEGLQGAAGLLLGEQDQKVLLQGITDAATRLAGAEFGAFFYNVQGEGGDRYMLYTLAGASPEAFAGMPMPRATAVFGPTFRGEGPLRMDDVREDPRFGKNPPYHGFPPGHLPVVSYLAVPVRDRSGEVLGGLFFGHQERARFGDREQRMVVALAAHAGLAIENVRTLEDARLARARAEDAEARLRVLADASEILSATLEYEVTLQAALDLTVPRFAACAGVEMGDGGGATRRVAMTCPDARLSEQLAALEARYAQDPEDATGIPRVIRMGQPELYPEVTDEVLERAARDPDHLAMLRELRLRSIVIVPMNSRGRTFGALWLAATDRVYGAADVELARRLGERMAAAIDNARLYAATQPGR